MGMKMKAKFRKTTSNVGSEDPPKKNNTKQQQHTVLLTAIPNIRNRVRVTLTLTRSLFFSFFFFSPLLISTTAGFPAKNVWPYSTKLHCITGSGIPQALSTKLGAVLKSASRNWPPNSPVWTFSTGAEQPCVWHSYQPLQSSGAVWKKRWASWAPSP